MVVPNVVPNVLPRANTLRGAAAGAVAGLLACVTGVGYILDNAASYPDIAWGSVGAVFVAQLMLTGALFGAIVTKTKGLLDGAIGRRTSWAPPIAASLATAIVAGPSGAFGAAYFGSLHAPFMGTTVIFSIACIIAIALAVSMAWLDQVEDNSQKAAPRLRRAAFAGVGLALPVVVFGGALAATTSDYEVLRMFRSTSPAWLGGLTGAGLGLVFGLYSGLVVGAVRRFGAWVLATPQATEEPARVRVALPLPLPLPVATLAKVAVVEEEEIDPLAEEDAELEARFAELDRLEKARLA